MKKPTVKKPRAFKLNVIEVLGMIDSNYRDYYQEISEEEQKALNGAMFTLLRWASTVVGSSVVEQHYVLTANEYYNKHYFTLAPNHPELLWLLLCMCSFNGNPVRHQWVATTKRATSNKRIKFLMDLYPENKPDEIELMNKLLSDQDIRDMAIELGWDDATIKKEL